MTGNGERKLGEPKAGSLFARFAANTGWLVAQNVFQYMLTAVIGILAARYMGPSNYGLLGYGATMMALLSPICTLGLDSVQIPAMVETPEQAGELIGTSAVLRLGSTTLSIAAITVIAAVTRPGEKLLLLVTVLQTLQLLFQTFDSFRLWFQWRLLSKYTAVGSVIGNLACSAWRIVLLIRGASVEWFSLTSVIQMLTNYLFVVPMFFSMSKLRLSVSLDGAKRLLRAGYHFILANLTIAVTNYFGKLILSYQLGDTALGLYNAAVSLAMMWLFVTQALVDSGMPVLLETKKSNPDAFEPRYQLLHLVIFLVGVCAGLGFTVLGPWMIDLLYGEAYAGAGVLIRIVGWIGIFSSIGTARGIWIFAEGKQKYVKYYCMVSAAASILFNSLGVWLAGAEGVAAAAILTGAVNALGAPLLFCETRPFVKQYFGSFRRFSDLKNWKQLLKRGA